MRYKAPRVMRTLLLSTMPAAATARHFAVLASLLCAIVLPGQAITSPVMILGDTPSPTSGRDLARSTRLRMLSRTVRA